MVLLVNLMREFFHNVHTDQIILLYTLNTSQLCQLYLNKVGKFYVFIYLNSINQQIVQH